MTDDRSILSAATEPEVSPLVMNRIADSVESHLNAKGFVKTKTREAADFVISFTVGTREKTYVDSIPFHYRGPWHWHPRFWDSRFITRAYTEGILAIDIFDQHSRAPVWHGWTRKQITSTDKAEPDKPIAAAVAAILANFPPPANTKSAQP